MELSEHECALADVVDGAIAFCRERAEQSGVKLRVEVVEASLVVRADELRLKKVLINLLTNAIKFTLPEGRVTVGACAIADGVLIEVKDTGIGMSPEEIRVALKRFGQVDQGINRKFEGSGLGLPLAQALVELHEGKLDIASESKVGTTVQVILPAARIVRRATADLELRYATSTKPS